ncbi:plasmid pRiA4b ORF-3 family protein [Longimicrobium sp.]|uniref:plasmid pRiA4b ORF-3 family protein n=1 Tax=Longimicrobium sp. TaxID=2029185 RepID=UPI002E3511A2|nr:plasmid pRiA4b ORF-3 family protein [Longimicrobium sp.]HEX6039217.1 plasmid pRiA4b ORF-3 family protein [Longimicrobium sp.]
MSSETPPRPPARRGRKPKPRLLHMRITLAKIEPPIWRHVRVPDAYTLDQLHRVIQMLFEWQDYHLYDFKMGERRFGPPHEEALGEDSTTVRLADLGLTKGGRLTYTYDFGDNWVHEVHVSGGYIAIPADGPDLPVLLEGERAGPPEDCGGPWGYAEMLEALRDANHPEHGPCRLWAGKYDPELFDVRMARKNLVLAAVWGAI